MRYRLMSLTRFLRPRYSIGVLALLGLSVLAIPAAAQSPAERKAEYIAEIPNVDWKDLDAEARSRAIRLMNAHDCPCNCGMTIAQCRRDDPACLRSPLAAAAIVSAVAAGKSDAEVVQSLLPPPAESEDSATITRVRIDPGQAPSVGPADAPVSLVELIDYQCPFCARADATIERLRQKYGDKLRWVVIQNPLDFHPDAPLAAEAALAAAAQGKFLEMHALLLERQDRLAREDLTVYAGELGLAVDTFEAALDAGRYRDRVTADRSLAESLGARSTPFFFVNGRPVRGAQPLAAFEKLIDEELSGDLRPTRWVDRAPVPPRRPAAREARPPEDRNRIYELDVSGSVARGPEQAPITLVEFTDFACSFCADQQAIVHRLLDDYPGKIRWVAMNRPLTRIHDSALPAALASLAAERQGKYWEYREILFAHQSALSHEDLASYAKELGLDLHRFESDRNDPETLERIEREVGQANEADVRGTPTLFVNGKKFAGLKSIGVLRAAIEEALAARVP